MGDGQRVSVRAQSNGLFFQSYNVSFHRALVGRQETQCTDRGGLAFHPVQWPAQEHRGRAQPIAADLDDHRGIGFIGQRWKQPDDWFTVNAGLSYQRFDFDQYNSGLFSFTDGRSNNIALNLIVSRNSVSDPIFPVWGSEVRLSVKATPPYSLFSARQGLERLERARALPLCGVPQMEVCGQLVHPLDDRRRREPQVVGVAHLFRRRHDRQYNRQIGLSPFERFYLGGVFLSGYVLDGREIISLRGYDNLSLTAPDQNTGAVPSSSTVPS